MAKTKQTAKKSTGGRAVRLGPRTLPSSPHLLPRPPPVSRSLSPGLAEVAPSGEDVSLDLDF